MEEVPAADHQHTDGCAHRPWHHLVHEVESLSPSPLRLGERPVFRSAMPLATDFGVSSVERLRRGGGDLQGAVGLLGEDDYLGDELVGVVVEDDGAVEGTALDARLEVEVLGGGTAGAPFECQWVASLEPLPYADEELGVVAVERLEAVGMPHHDAVAVAVVGGAEDDLAGEGGTNGVVGVCLHVGACMVARTAEGADEVGTGERIAPLLDGVVGEVDGELVGLFEGVAGGLHLHHLPFVDVGLVFVLCL